jgi:tRNA(fMet)-specific endonuclease VapC
MTAQSPFLLDTNIVLALMRSNSLGRSIDLAYQLRTNLNRSLISIVTVGEMQSLARQFRWSGAKLESLRAMLDELVVLDISDPTIPEAYGEIDEYCRKAGRPMGENDVWIAATTRISGACLLTTDKDFDIVATSWIDRIWIDPNTGNKP